jgi:hypothetical protein
MVVLKRGDCVFGYWMLINGGGDNIPYSDECTQVGSEQLAGERHFWDVVAMEQI